jgi:hypothetical protein
LSGVGPVGRVTTMLEQAGYEGLDQPRSIGGVPFEFAAMFVGRTSLDLIAVLDLAIDADEERIRRRVEALARALDLVSSRRSLTVILVGPRPPQSLIQAIAEVARVLAVGTPAEGDDASLQDALAVLLPLELVTENEEKDGGGSDWEDARKRLLAEHPTELATVLAAAGRGQTAVTEALRVLLIAPFEGEEDDDEGKAESE